MSVSIDIFAPLSGEIVNIEDVPPCLSKVVALTRTNPWGRDLKRHDEPNPEFYRDLGAA